MNVRVVFFILFFVMVLGVVAAITPAPMPSPVPDMSMVQYLDTHPLAAFGMWFILLFAVFSATVFLWRIAGMKLPFNIRKVKIPGGVEVELDADGNPRTMCAFNDMAFDYADYVVRLKDREVELLDEVKQNAREATRRHVDDFIAQIKGLNHEYYNVAIGSKTIMQRDTHFNTIVRGDVKLMLTKQLLDIFDRNHLLAMDDTEYKNVMVANYHRVKRLVYASLSEDWNHPAYSFDVFQLGMEEFSARGERDFLLLMERFRNLAKNRREVKEETKKKARDVRLYAKTHGCLPDSCADI